MAIVQIVSVSTFEMANCWLGYCDFMTGTQGRVLWDFSTYHGACNDGCRMDWPHPNPFKLSVHISIPLAHLS